MMGSEFKSQVATVARVRIEMKVVEAVQVEETAVELW
jgi:hypothetical protein